MTAGEAADRGVRASTRLLLVPLPHRLICLHCHAGSYPISVVNGRGCPACGSRVFVQVQNDGTLVSARLTVPPPEVSRPGTVAHPAERR